MPGKRPTSKLPTPLSAVPDEFEVVDDETAGYVEDPDAPDYTDDDAPDIDGYHSVAIVPPRKEQATVTDTSGMPMIEVASTFSRTLQVQQFEPQKAEVTIRQSFPGTMTPQEVVELVQSQFVQIKSQVLLELGLPFEQDDETGRLIESFPGSTVVASRPAPNPPAVAPPRAPAAPARTAPAARRPAAASGTPPKRQQASRGAQGGSGGQTPSVEDMWSELLDYPHLWNDVRGEKEAGSRKPDFTSTQYMNDRGYPVGLWLNDTKGRAPSVDEIPDEGFANY